MWVQFIYVQEIWCQHSYGHCGLLAPSKSRQWAHHGPENEHKGKLKLWQNHVVASIAVILFCQIIYHITDSSHHLAWKTDLCAGWTANMSEVTSNLIRVVCSALRDSHKNLNSYRYSAVSDCSLASSQNFLTEGILWSNPNTNLLCRKGLLGLHWNLKIRFRADRRFSPGMQSLSLVKLLLISHDQCSRSHFVLWIPYVAAHL